MEVGVWTQGVFSGHHYILAHPPTIPHTNTQIYTHTHTHKCSHHTHGTHMHTFTRTTHTIPALTTHLKSAHADRKMHSPSLSQSRGRQPVVPPPLPLPSKPSCLGHWTAWASPLPLESWAAETATDARQPSANVLWCTPLVPPHHAVLHPFFSKSMCFVSNIPPGVPVYQGVMLNGIKKGTA